MAGPFRPPSPRAHEECTRGGFDPHVNVGCISSCRILPLPPDHLIPGAKSRKPPAYSGRLLGLRNAISIGAIWPRTGKKYGMGVEDGILGRAGLSGQVSEGRRPFSKVAVAATPHPALPPGGRAFHSLGNRHSWSRAQRGEVNFPRSHSWQGPEEPPQPSSLGLGPGPSSQQAKAELKQAWAPTPAAGGRWVDCFRRSAPPRELTWQSSWLADSGSDTPKPPVFTGKQPREQSSPLPSHLDRGAGARVGGSSKENCKFLEISGPQPGTV